ncbi:probable methyltransferase-like protein 24 [Eriocheir sinensis]|uniref:probable methyltransferase-like protein 24 n=1 Tax=Eriocheir sinensis TaxID=95602 RepID=UPI0021C5BCAD|nr:probable methyltransferase-like protein 24 [Eriocheir sinensis]XP_050716955.1 probable methyltransferase-like protein 24 [Eriocheir sinensis]XP_050716956.1 probable methyltransferase-like protein 24 [Eriocheir sinensis]
MTFSTAVVTKYKGLTAVAVTAALLMLLAYALSHTSSSVFKDSAPRVLGDASRCHIPGLASIEQYQEYLHHKETICTRLHPFGGKPPAPEAGMKMVCLDSRFNIKPGDCVVFSFGVGNEWSFEDEFDNFGCKVYAYDPTMGKEDHQRSPNVRFFATGIANYKGTKKVGMGKKWMMRPVDRFENLVRMVGEEGREIDFVKLDVELSEIDFLQDMLFNSPHVLAKIKQLAIEIHDGPFKGDFSQTSTHQVFWPYFMFLRCAGFRVIHTRETWGWREVVWARSY